jgi:hypothetical protein
MKSKKQTIKELNRRIEKELVRLNKYKEQALTLKTFPKVLRISLNLTFLLRRLYVVKATPAKFKFQKSSRAAIGERNNEVIGIPIAMDLVPEINKYGVMQMIPRCIQKEKPN